MRAVVQRVLRANVTIDGVEAARIGLGNHNRVGGGAASHPGAAPPRLWKKIFSLRIMEDEAGKTNRSIDDVGGDVLVVSQFTLFADCRHGRRPSFTGAGDPAHANELYEYFVSLARADVPRVATGTFAADM